MFHDKKRNLQKYATESLSGTHLCSIYKNKAEQISVIIPYLLYGLKNNEKCVYIIDENTQEDICSWLEMSGVDLDSFIESGQLTFLVKEQTYLQDGFFIPERIFDSFERMHYETLRGGHNNLRGTAEMTWALHNLPGCNRLIPYESEANRFFSHRRLVSVCQYNEKRFPENVLYDVLRTHPKVIISGVFYENPFYVPFERFEKEMELEYVPGSYERLKSSIINSTK